MIASLLAATSLIAPARPTLVVVLAVDQLRPDYLTRFESLFLPATSGERVGGFRYLGERGATFVNSRYRHLPTETGPGHAIISTGSVPAVTGIIANTWYDRGLKRSLYCVADPDAKDVLTGKPSSSPRNLKVTTLVDELELATNGSAKTAAIALKDRAAILLGGRLPDGTVWYDRVSGKWTTSDVCARGGTLPAWAATANGWNYSDRFRGRRWEAKVPRTVADKMSFPTAAPNPPSGFGDAFPHTLPEQGFYDVWAYTPWANDFVIATALEAVDQLTMGRDEVPDVLMLNLCTNDYLGHSFGPYSPEVLEITVETDRAISDLLNGLKNRLPAGLERVAVAITSDHGVMPMSEDLSARGIPSTRAADEFWNRVKAKVAEAVGADAIAYRDDSQLYLDHAKLKAAGIPLDRARRAAATALASEPLVFRAFPFETLQTPSQGDEFDVAMRNGFDPERSPDVVFLLRPAVYASAKGAGHGSAWRYDTAVPFLLVGPGVAPGRHLDATGPEDIAPTLAAILGISTPSGSVGRVVGLRP